MNPIRILITLAVVAALAVTGFYLYRDPEESVIARGEVEQRQTGTTVQVPASAVESSQPTPRVPAAEAPAAERREPQIVAVEPREPEPRETEPRVPEATVVEPRAPEARVVEPVETEAPVAKTRATEERSVARAMPEATAPRVQEVRPAPPEPAPVPATDPAPSPAPVPPSFDVVRVERSGETVLAGRAAPNSRVNILADGQDLGEARADGRGQWVLVPEQKLAPGGHELRLESTGADGRVVQAENVVVVSVPQPRVTAATPAPRPLPVEQPAADRSPADPVPSEQIAAKQPEPEQPAPIQEKAGATMGLAASAVSETRPPQETERPLVVLMPSSGQGPSRILQDAESPGGGLGRESLVLETVDYDDDGNAVIGGRADPGARLIAYLDAVSSGDTVASAQGRWLVNLDKAIAVGLHQLRVDQVDGTGKVLARIETPFSRVAAVSVPAGETTVIVQPGNSLWRIARRVYGRGVRFSVIYRANKDQIRDPDLIYPGQIFVVPGRS